MLRRAARSPKSAEFGGASDGTSDGPAEAATAAGGLARQLDLAEAAERRREPTRRCGRQVHVGVGRRRYRSTSATLGSDSATDGRSISPNRAGSPAGQTGSVRRWTRSRRHREPRRVGTGSAAAGIGRPAATTTGRPAATVTGRSAADHGRSMRSRCAGAAGKSATGVGRSRSNACSCRRRGRYGLGRRSLRRGGDRAATDGQVRDRYRRTARASARAGERRGRRLPGGARCLRRRGLRRREAGRDDGQIGLVERPERGREVRRESGAGGRRDGWGLHGGRHSHGREPADAPRPSRARVRAIRPQAGAGPPRGAGGRRRRSCASRRMPRAEPAERSRPRSCDAADRAWVPPASARARPASARARPASARARPASARQRRASARERQTLRPARAGQAVQAHRRAPPARRSRDQERVPALGAPHLQTRGGTRRSSIWYGALHDSHSTLSIERTSEYHAATWRRDSCRARLARYIA